MGSHSCPPALLRATFWEVPCIGPEAFPWAGPLEAEHEVMFT